MKKIILVLVVIALISYALIYPSQFILSPLSGIILFIACGLTAEYLTQKI